MHGSSRYTLVGGSQASGSNSQAARLVMADPTAPLETTRFRAPARGETGNLGSNTLRQAGFWTSDVSMYREIKFNGTHQFDAPL